jgi:DcrB-like protein
VRRLGLVLALLVALLPSACGGDDDGGGGGDKKAEGKRAEGSAYAVALPEGWSDRTDDASNEDVPIRFDRVFATRYEDGFRTNVNVIRERKPANLSLEQVAQVSQRQVRNAYGATDLTPARASRLGDEDARAYTYSLEAQGKSLRGEQVIAIRDDRIFYVTFTALRTAYDGRHPQFEDILGSWSWK